MKEINSVLALIYREYKIAFNSFYDILSILLFFTLSVLIFVFSIGSDKQIFNQIGVGVIWSLILLSNNLALSRFYEDDFNNNNMILFHISGLSYELIVLIKLILNWIFIQLPFFLIIPIAMILLDLTITNSNLIFISFLIGSPILTSITSIAASMNLLNNKSFALGSLIIMFLSIPIIIFSVGLINAPTDNVNNIINILIGILLIFLAITPWISAACIKLAIKNK